MQFAAAWQARANQLSCPETTSCHSIPVLMLGRWYAVAPRPCHKWTQESHYQRSNGRKEPAARSEHQVMNWYSLSPEQPSSLSTRQSPCEITQSRVVSRDRVFQSRLFNFSFCRNEAFQFWLRKFLNTIGKFSLSLQCYWNLVYPFIATKILVSSLQY